ncbi:hypothetical protein UlMin_038825 [Ulmus minor]
MEDFETQPSSPPESAVYPAENSDKHADRHHHHHPFAGESGGPRFARPGFSRRQPRRGPPKVLPGQAEFRLLCDRTVVGGIIGNSGSIVSQLQRETEARIHCEKPAPGSDQAEVFIVGSGSPEKTIVLTGEVEEVEEYFVSRAQDAMLKVSERIWTVEAQNGGGEDSDLGVVCSRLLAQGFQNRIVMGKGGANIERMRKESGASIRIFPAQRSMPAHDEIIMISGKSLAVKKALIAVSGCLQDHQNSGETSLSTTSSSESYLHESSLVSNPNAEVSQNLRSFSPQNSFSNVSEDYSMIDSNGVSSNDTKGALQKVEFRLLCSNVEAGSVIGRKGSIVKALENHTGAAIKFSAPSTSSIERVVTICAFENLESWQSPARNAVLLVFARTVEGNAEKRFRLGFNQGIAVKLLVASDLVGCLNGDGRVIPEMKKVTGTDIQIFRWDPEDQIIQITGEYESVKNALSLVTTNLRDQLLPSELLNEVRARSPFGRVLPNTNEAASLTSEMSRLGLSHSTGALPPWMQLPQTVESGHNKGLTNGGEDFKTFGENLESVSKTKLATVTNTTVEIVVSEHAFGSVYGEDGRNLDRLREISGAKVEVLDPSPGESEGKVIISGTPNQTLAAQSLLQAFLQTTKSKHHSSDII